MALVRTQGERLLSYAIPVHYLHGKVNETVVDTPFGVGENKERTQWVTVFCCCLLQARTEVGKLKGSERRVARNIGKISAESFRVGERERKW